MAALDISEASEYSLIIYNKSSHPHPMDQSVPSALPAPCLHGTEAEVCSRARCLRTHLILASQGWD